MPGEAKSNLTDGGTWLRGLLIILFGLLYSVAEIVLTVVVVLQFGSQLLTGAPNARLLDFARALNAYVYQILQFVTYRAEVRPFPLGQWPTQGLADVGAAELAEAVPGTTAEAVVPAETKRAKPVRRRKTVAQPGDGAPGSGE